MRAARRAARPHDAGARSREKDDVDDVEKRIETDHDRDRGDDARGGGGADTSRAALHSEPAIAGDGPNEQPKHEALRDAEDDVAHEQAVQDEILEIDEGDIEVRARDERGCE